MFHDAYDLLSRIPESARVLDIGGAEDVFPRADAVLDAVPYAARKRQCLPEVPERFNAESWHVGDICDSKVWSKFGDKSFDFVLCSHTLEDVRDPIFVCSQILRCGRAGYIETPSRFRECAKSSATEVEAGWGHHRWILDVESDRLIFTPKMGWAHHFDYLGQAKRSLLSNRLNNYTGVLWEGGFDYVERFPKGPVIEAENLFYFYENYVDRATEPVSLIRNAAHRGKTFEWITEFLLPVERRVGPAELLGRWERRRRGEPIEALAP